jgi:hypothetical protein
MAQNASFDITTGVDLQEVDNAVNMATKELATRYDFKGTSCTVEFDRKAGAIKLDADDEYRLKALLGVVREKLTRRNVPVKNLDEGAADVGTMGRARQTISLKQGIDQETAKRISKDIRDGGFKKVQVQIQGEELRVTSPSRDTLQEVMALVRAGDYGMELAFGNYR